MKYAAERQYVLEHIDLRTFLEQYAEEASENAQAALKCIRADKNCHCSNPTPVSVHEAYDLLQGEFFDLCMVADALNLTADDTSWNPKWKRWADRIKEKQQTEKGSVSRDNR